MDTPKKFPNYELFYFRSCPFCIKAIVAMKLMGIKIPLRNIKDDANYKSELIAGGGKKQVPCLKIKNEQGEVQWMYESSDIISHFKNHLSD